MPSGYDDDRGNNYAWVQGHSMASVRATSAARPVGWKPAVASGAGSAATGSGGPYGDRDHDGIANRYDHRDNNLRPDGDRDGDGVLNKDDRFPFYCRRS